MTVRTTVSERKHVIVPSQVGLGDTDMGYLSTGLARRRGPKPYRVAWGLNGTQYLVGEGVEYFAEPLQTTVLDRLADGPDARALTYAALGALLGPGEHRIALVVGLPVQVMADRSAARDTIRRMKAWLLGRHRFRFDGKETVVEVAALKVLTQGLGAFYAWALDDAGKPVRRVQDLKAPVGVVDVGFNTVDLFTVREGRVDRRLTAGDREGVRRAVLDLLEYVRRQYRVRLSYMQADALLRQKRPVLSYAGGDVDLSDAVRHIVDRAGRRLAEFIEATWDREVWGFRHVLAVGGGARLFWPHLRRVLPHALLMSRPDPVLANAVGFARYGRMVMPDAETVVGLDPGFGAFKAVLL